jgi:hypothetical protein
MLWLTGLLRALLWPLFPWSAWAQRATVLSDTAGDGAVASSVRLDGVGSSSHGVGRHDW